MAQRWDSDLVGTLTGFFRINAVRLKDSSGLLQVRNAGDSAFAKLQALALTSTPVEPRVTALTDAATVTPNCDTTDIGNLSSLSQTTTFANPTGTPVDGQLLILRVTSSSSRTISFGTNYEQTANLPLPASTTGGGVTDFYGFRYSSTSTKWQIIASSASNGGISTLLDEIGSTQGQTLFRGPSGWQALAAGTLGQFLQTQGSGANPVWATPGGIGLGVTPANNATDTVNDIDFVANGQPVLVKGSSGNLWVTPAAGTVIKQADAAWAAGNNAGGRFTALGTDQANVYYFLIYNPTTQLIDYGFDTSISAANRPSGFTHYRCVGWGKWAASAWRLFDQVGAIMRWRGVETFSTFADGTTTDRTIDAPSQFDCFVDLIVFSGHAASGSAGNSTWFGSTNESAPTTLAEIWAAGQRTLTAVNLSTTDVRLQRDSIRILAKSGQIRTRTTIAGSSTVTNASNWVSSNAYPGYLVQAIDLSPLIYA